MCVCVCVCVWMCGGGGSFISVTLVIACRLLSKGFLMLFSHRNTFLNQYFIGFNVKYNHTYSNCLLMLVRNSCSIDY